MPIQTREMFTEYFLRAFQALDVTALPPWLSLTPDRAHPSFVIDWPGVRETLKTPTSFFAAQLVVATPRNAALCPGLADALTAYETWLFAGTPGFTALFPEDAFPARDVTRLRALCQQLGRFLFTHPKAYDLLAKSLLDVLEVPSLDATTLVALPTRAHLPLAPATPQYGATTLHEELRAMLRGERDGTHKLHNYLVVGHARVAKFAELLGTPPPWAPQDVGPWLRDTFRVLRDPAARRCFANTPALAHAAYDPADYSVVVLSDITRRLTVAEGGAHRGRRRLTADDAPRPQTREVTAVSPGGVTVATRWRHGVLHVDTASLPCEVSLVGLATHEILALDATGRQVTALSGVRRFVTLRALTGRYPAHATLWAWLAATYPTQATWRAAARRRPGSPRRPRPTFTPDQDRLLLETTDRYTPPQAWQALATAWAPLRVTAIRRRATYVHRMVRYHHLTLATLASRAEVKARVGEATWRKWKDIA